MPGLRRVAGRCQDWAVLVTRRAGSLVLVTQPDHAAIAGVLARHWGNQQFATPAAREALVCAAEHHDDGWLELDARPMFNHEQARPAHFVELPLADTAPSYARGVESVYERDQQAGALVSMHFSGFYTSRWGVGGGGPSDNPLALEVVATQEAALDAGACATRGATGGGAASSTLTTGTRTRSCKRSTCCRSRCA